MKRLLLILFVIAIAGFSYSAQTITDLNTNTPIPLGQLLTITGTFDDTDSNNSIFCKFLTKKNNLIVERLTDERTFANGDFYSQRSIQEPLYERGEFYVVSVTCESVTQDTNFTVDQRDALDRLARQEFLFVFEQGNTDVFFILGTIIFGIIIVGLIFFFLIRSGFK